MYDGRTTVTYSGENAYLYKVTGMVTTTRCYAVGDGSGKYSHFFPLGVGNTTVTQDIVFAELCEWLIRLTLPTGESTFDFYQDMNSLDINEFSVSFNVHELICIILVMPT